MHSSHTQNGESKKTSEYKNRSQIAQPILQIGCRNPHHFHTLRIQPGVFTDTSGPDTGRRSKRKIGYQQKGLCSIVNCHPLASGDNKSLNLGIDTLLFPLPQNRTATDGKLHIPVLVQLCR